MDKKKTVDKFKNLVYEFGIEILALFMAASCVIVLLEILGEGYLSMLIFAERLEKLYIISAIIFFVGSIVFLLLGILLNKDKLKKIGLELFCGASFTFIPIFICMLCS